MQSNVSKLGRWKLKKKSISFFFCDAKKRLMYAILNESSFKEKFEKWSIFKFFFCINSHFQDSFLKKLIFRYQLYMKKNSLKIDWIWRISQNNLCQLILYHYFNKSSNNIHRTAWGVTITLKEVCRCINSNKIKI
jgi:hypothetical protein